MKDRKLLWKFGDRAYKDVLAVNEQSMLSVEELGYLSHRNINHTTSHEAAVGGSNEWAELFLLNTMIPFVTRKNRHTHTHTHTHTS